MTLKLKSALIYLGFSLLLASCGVIIKPDSRLSYDEFIVENSTASLITDIEIRVVALNYVFHCGIVLPESSCSNKFQLRPYEANPIIIGWQDGDGLHQVGPLVIGAPGEFSQEEIFKVILRVEPGGQLSAFFTSKKMLSQH